MTTKQLTIVTDFTEEERDFLWKQGVNMDDWEMGFLYERDAEYDRTIDQVTSAVVASMHRGMNASSYSKVTLDGKNYDLEMVYHG